MKVPTKLAVGALVILLGAASKAQDSSQDELKAAAQVSGLSVVELKMLLSNHPTAFTTAYLTYDVSARRLRRAVQDGRVRLLPSTDGVGSDFATWQGLPNRALSFVPSAPAEVAQAAALGQKDP